MSTKTPAAPAFSTKQIMVALYTAAIAFLTYACIFAYRKAFTVATFEGQSFWGIKYQTLLIISQGLGYMASKFYGIRFISELKRLGRWKTSAVLIGLAWLCLLLFAWVPAPWGMLCLFGNGFMLGFMWGIIFSYAEGRRATDFIGAAMAVSFVFAGGFSRSVAVWLRDSWHVGEQWLGFATGLVFALPLVVFMLLLERVPQPDDDDIKERSMRLPMTREDRRNFLRLFGGGIVAVVITYLFLTIMRDVRDNFMANMWNELGYGQKPAIFTKTETITSVIVLVVMSLLVIVRKNIKALRLIHWVIVAGFLIAGISSALFLTGAIPGVLWMQLAGLGLYMGYIPFNCIYFERLIAAFKITGNVGFLIYIADAWGYLGSMSVHAYKRAGGFAIDLDTVLPHQCGYIFSGRGIGNPVLPYLF
ncbi:MFS family permease [Chitinophagaceae bacterium OAS944]